MNPYVFRYSRGDRPEPLPELAEDAKLFSSVMEEIHGLFIERNNVYRSRFREVGIPGVLGWINTKLQRMATGLISQSSVEDEDLTEHFLDLAVYAAIGAMLHYYGDRAKVVCRHLFMAEPAGEPPAGPGHTAGRCVLCGERVALWLNA